MDVPTNIRNMCVIAQYVQVSDHSLLVVSRSGANLAGASIGLCGALFARLAALSVLSAIHLLASLVIG